MYASGIYGGRPDAQPRVHLHPVSLIDIWWVTRKGVIATMDARTVGMQMAVNMEEEEGKCPCTSAIQRFGNVRVLFPHRLSPSVCVCECK